MNYINLKKKRFVGRNNQPIFNQFIIDYSTVEDVSFQIIDDKNQIQEITDTEGLYFAGSVGIGKQSYELLFLSKDYKVVDNIINAICLDAIVFLEAFANVVFHLIEHLEMFACDVNSRKHCNA